MDQRLIGESEEVRNYIEYPEVEIITSNCCGCPCCCKVAYFPIQKLTFIGHWRKSLPTPIIVGFFYLITIISYFWDTYNTFPDVTDLIISYFFTSFTFFCFIFGYYAIIIKGPGYVPYSWINTHQRSYTWEETIRDIAIYNDQVKSARSSPNRPKRSCFSKDARRFVLRADHFCRLGKSWIGLKNYRYFLLTCLYCFLFSISITLSRTWLYEGIYRYYKTKKNNSTYSFNLNNGYYQSNIAVNKNHYILNDLTKHIESRDKNYNSNNNFGSKDRNNINNLTKNTDNNHVKYEQIDDEKTFKFRIWYVFGIITNLIACFFGFSSLFTFYRNFYNLYRNVTTFELMTKKRIGKWDRGCVYNFEEVCGSRKYFLCWPFPFFILEPMESGFYDEIWNQNTSNFDAGSQGSKYQTMDSLY